MLNEISEPDYAKAAGDRVEELLWVLDHLDDLDADFLAIYGIDLHEQEIGARRYFALAHRLTAYQGVMAARVEEERDEQPAAGTTPTRTQHTAPPPQQGSSEAVEVSLTQFRAMYPGWVSVAQEG